MNTDTVTTLAGAGTATAILSQINFSAPGWWKQALVAAGVLALGYYANKVKIPPPAAPAEQVQDAKQKNPS